MYELEDFQQEESEFEQRSRTVSFPDHYLIPFIEWCKRSKCITCGCSIMFFGLAIFCFFATNYMINYPATVSRKIALIFAAFFCVVCGVTCFELRFRILKQCRDGPNDNVVFEIAHRDTGVSATSSFSGHFEMQETSFSNGTPIEGSSQIETPGDSSSLGRSVDEVSAADISTSTYNGRDHLAMYSISNGLSPDSPLLPLRRPLEILRTSWMQNGTDSKGVYNGGTASGCNNSHPNYSTFENEIDALETKPLLTQ